MSQLDAVSTVLSDLSSLSGEEQQDTESYSFSNGAGQCSAAGVVDWGCIRQLRSGNVKNKVTVNVRDEDAVTKVMISTSKKSQKKQHTAEWNVDQTEREESARWDGKREGRVGGPTTAPLLLYYHLPFI